MRLNVGDPIPPWTMPEVTPARMRTVAAILRDPTPIHWDRESTRALGFEGRLLNQTPLNVAYVTNMLTAWAGPGCVRRFRLAFPQPVFDGDAVVAGGEVLALHDDDGEAVAECAVWLDRADDARCVVGEAWVVVG